MKYIFLLFALAGCSKGYEDKIFDMMMTSISATAITKAPACFSIKAYSEEFKKYEGHFCVIINGDFIDRGGR